MGYQDRDVGQSYDHCDALAREIQDLGGVSRVRPRSGSVERLVVGEQRQHVPPQHPWGVAR